MKLIHLPRTIAALAAVMLIDFSNSAQAGNTWTGGGASTNWSDNSNWGGAAPAYGTISFSGTTRTNNHNNSITAMNQVNWNGTAAWSMSGSSTLSLFDFGGTQAKLEALGTGSVNINAPITFAANNGSPPNPFGEINAVSSDLLFSGNTVTVNGASCNGIKLFGSSRVVTFNNTVSASGKWFGITTGGTGNTINIGGSFTSSDFYVMNDGILNLNSGGSLSTAVRLGGDFGNTGNQNLAKTGTFNLTATTGGQTFSGVINPVTGNTSGTLAVNSQNTSGTTTLSGHIALDANLKITQTAGGTLNITQVKGGDNTTGTDIKGNILTLTPAATGTIAISGTIYNSTGTGSVLMNGGGTLTLSGANTYTGTTTVSNGTLLVNGATSSGAVIVTSGARVGGVGSIGGTITVQSGGTLAPGTNGIGTLTNAASPSLSGTALMEINRAVSPNADKLVRSGGSLTYGGTLTVTNIGSVAQNGDTFTLFNASSYSGTFTSLNLPPGGTAHWKTNNLVVDGSIRFTNNNPVAQNVTLGVARGETISYQVIGVGKHSATDADGDGLTVTSVSAPGSGTSGFTASNVTYIASGSTGTNTFTYTVTDIAGGTDTRTVTVVVNDPQGFNTLSATNILGTAYLTYLGIPGTNYALQVTHALPATNWTAVITNVAQTNGYLYFTNPVSLAPTNDYYRTHYVP